MELIIGAVRIAALSAIPAALTTSTAPVSLLRPWHSALQRYQIYSSQSPQQAEGDGVMRVRRDQ